MFEWLVGRSADVAQKSSVMFHCVSRPYNKLMWHVAIRERREEGKSVSDTIHADSNPSDVPKDDLAHDSPSAQLGPRPTASPRLDEEHPTHGTGTSTQQSEHPPPEQPMPRQDTDDSGVDVTPTRDVDEKEEYMSQVLQADDDTLLPVYSASPPGIELVKTRLQEKGRQKRIQAFQNLTEKRETVIGLRLRVHEARNSLRHDRESLNNRDAQLVQRLRAAIASNALREQTPLVDDLEDLQKSRDSLQPKEDDYNRLEDQLNREEWELKEMELRLYQRSGSAQISLLGDDEVGFFEATLDETNSSSSLSIHSGPVEDSPKTKRYLSRRGDAILLREQIAEMRATKAQIIEDKDVRERIGLVLDEDSQYFLDHFDSRLQLLLEDLVNVEEDISRLHEALTDRDVTVLSNPFDGEGWDASTHYAAEAILSDSPRAAAVEFGMAELDPLTRDPLLLPVDDQKHVLFDSSDPGTPNVISTPGYINRWLLHRLRRSIPEVRRYKSAEELKQLRLGQERIKDLVLEWWYKDKSVADFRSARNTAALSLDLPLQLVPARTYRAGARSESAVPIVQELLTRAPSELTPAALVPPAAPMLQSFNALSLDGSHTMHPF
jgi:hypothetical protein